MSQDWLVYLQTSNYGWAADTAFPRPNENLETQIVSTQTKGRLADGSNVFITPENKRVKEAFGMTFIDTTTALRTQIENYMINGDTIKIVTHTGEEFIGRIIDMKRVWFVGTFSDEYDIQIMFELTQY